jgi:hypothetical protein
LTEDELEQAAITFLEYRGHELPHTCEETAKWINESKPEYYELQVLLTEHQK